ncbi:hypothetical protein MKX08_002703 [Trichoderma sp. CBMAI-0020]|nr:hypothetical protein MKX08_002703 [Trichoderma sp. CBMAI-0020]
MGNTDDLPPDYGVEDQMLLPPPYHGRNDDPTSRNDGVVGLIVFGKASGTISKYWKWIAEEVASSMERHGKNSDMCFGACCRG